FFFRRLTLSLEPDGLHVFETLAPLLERRPEIAWPALTRVRRSRVLLSRLRAPRQSLTKICLAAKTLGAEPGLTRAALRAMRPVAPRRIAAVCVEAARIHLMEAAISGRVTEVGGVSVT